ncbi:MAG: sugar ABC transporter ATP-binding protein [Clostridiales bacterium]|nr:sugar ABC transporter ATP-binding protein [Clostridiales bacterium]
MALELSGISKSYGSNLVLDNVDFSLSDGEIHALLGENGAGKSTLMNILGGVVKADKGRICLDGNEIDISSPSDAIRHGIAFIHQELNLINDLSVYENLFIGEELRRFTFLSKGKMLEKARNVLAEMGADIPPDALVGELDAGSKQIVEIARSLLFNARTIIMDEPTTSLGEKEIARVFELMRSLKRRGVSIIFISHKLREVMEICDRYTVLRDGCVAGKGDIPDTDETQLALLMVGHAVNGNEYRRTHALGGVALEAQDLASPPFFSDISFSLRHGEILGFTGLLGDGRSELFQAIFGFLPVKSGRIRLEGKAVRISSPRKAAALGIGYVPPDRKENGIIKDLTILENGSIVIYERIRRFLFTDHRREKALMLKNARELNIKYSGLGDSILSLSGGNQQKVVLARWLSAESLVLIFDNPTQGVDVGAKEDIYRIISRLAQEGCAIVVLSGEAQEITRLCERAYVMYHGKIAGELSGDELNENSIMLLATGAKQARLA